VSALVERLRAICTEFPEVVERPSHGTPTWFVRAGGRERSFVMLWPDGHHDNEFPHLWCAAPPGAQQELIAAVPKNIFRPPYVGGRGWLGVRLDGDVDWDEIAELCQDAYRTVAPAALVERLDGPSGMQP
jgi:hypothetical protein